MVLPSLIMYPLQGYILQECPAFHVSFEWYFQIFQLILFVVIVLVLFDLWKNSDALKEVKLFWTFVLVFIIPSATILMYLWLYLDGSKGYAESIEELRT